MIKSMTSFGRSSEVFGDMTVTVEIRSVNNRYLDCSAKLPRRWSFLEEKIKPYIISRGISRGKVDISVTLEAGAGQAVASSLDLEYAKAYIDDLKTLRDAFGLPDDITVMAVAQNAALFKPPVPSENEEEDEKILMTVLAHATDSFIEGRISEGSRIEADLRNKAQNILSSLETIEKFSADDISQHMAKLRERISSLMKDSGLQPDDARLLTECAIYADKIAVDEETVRLHSHLKAFFELLASNEAVGRKIDFLLQEMNREINTIGSKCCNASIAQTVVNLKNELEKIREQIQNIE